MIFLAALVSRGITVMEDEEELIRGGLGPNTDQALDLEDLSDLTDISESDNDGDDDDDDGGGGVVDDLAEVEGHPPKRRRFE